MWADAQDQTLRSGLEIPGKSARIHERANRAFVVIMP